MPILYLRPLSGASGSRLVVPLNVAHTSVLFGQELPPQRGCRAHRAPTVVLTLHAPPEQKMFHIIHLFHLFHLCGGRRLEAHGGQRGRPRTELLTWRATHAVTRRDAMRDAVPDWEVNEQGWKVLTSCLTLPDPDDVHVLAAAIAAHADCLAPGVCRAGRGKTHGNTRCRARPQRAAPEDQADRLRVGRCHRRL